MVYRVMAQDAIMHLCAELDIEIHFILSPWNNGAFAAKGWKENRYLTRDFVQANLSYIHAGRDLQHPGIDLHKAIAQEFNHKYQTSRSL